jgi:hypothetical protein
MASAKTSLFPLPEAQVVETVYVKLSDGRIVPRSPEELLQTQPDTLGSMPAIPSST